MSVHPGDAVAVPEPEADASTKGGLQWQDQNDPDNPYANFPFMYALAEVDGL